MENSQIDGASKELVRAKKKSVLSRRRRSAEKRAKKWTQSGPLREWDLSNDGCVFMFQHLVVTVHFFADGNARFLVAGELKSTRPPSFAVQTVPESVVPTVIDQTSYLEIAWYSSTLILKKETGMFHLEGRRSETAGTRIEYVNRMCFSTSEDDYRFEMALKDDEHIYGLGEKMGLLDKQGRTWQMWNTDEGNHKPSADPLYQSIPFYLQFSPVRTTGVFVDSTAWSWFDMGDTEPGTAAVEVRDEYLDLYLLTGETPGNVIGHYTLLTGCIPLPPEWALGFQQCRYSYYPEQRVREIASTMREKHIPCDVIYLDIHYMEGYRVFTWHEQRFPDPRKLIDDLNKQGFKVITIVDPGVKADPDYAVYRDGLNNNAFCRFPGGEMYVGKVWPGDAVFPDFTRKDVRRWWAEHHRELMERGVSGIWNDMNEPADFTGSKKKKGTYTVPNSVLLDNEGHPRPFLRYHNAYGLAMCRATREAFPLYRNDERGFVLTRSGYAGVQRYAAVWTGDNASWWEHLAASLPMLLNMGISGVPFVGSDTGGFQENAPGDLFARWMAASSLTPFFRAHTGRDTLDHEPWSFGPEIEAACRSFIQLRYQLFPYLYTVFEESSRTGQPIMRALVLDYPEQERAHTLDDEYLFGPSLLVAPIVQANKEHRSVYLPAGRWYDFWTGEVHDGPGDILAFAPLDRIPLYVRGGSVIPRESVRQHTGEKSDGVLELSVYPDEHGKAAGVLYADDGEGFGYRQGRFLRLSFELEKGMLRLQTEHSGHSSRWNRVLARLSPNENARSATTSKNSCEIDFAAQREIIIPAG